MQTYCHGGNPLCSFGSSVVQFNSIQLIYIVQIHHKCRLVALYVEIITPITIIQSSLSSFQENPADFIESMACST